MTVSADDDFLWRLRWLLVASCAAITFAVIVLLSTVPTNWRWPLLVWGVLIGVVGDGILVLTARFALNSPAATSDARAIWARRRIIYAGLWLFVGALTGVVSAAFDLPWIEVVVAIYAALSLGAGLVMVMVVGRRR
jgi:hypothetical protein